MKVLLNHSGAFALAHGGFQVQIEGTRIGLERIGVDVEYLRWWDDQQKGDIIHYFGRMPAWQIQLAQEKGIKVVLGELLTGTGSRTKAQLRLQKAISRTIERFAPRQFIHSFNWDSYRLADACIANTPWEAHLMNYLFDAPTDRIHIVPNGVEDVFLESTSVERGPWLVCTATITERKRVLELAQAAVKAKTPVWVIGKAYAESHPYAQRFFQFAKDNPEFVRYEGPIHNRAALAGIYRAARGFVLLSTMETLSLSSGEASACRCPMMLSDLPWARTSFGENAFYCPIVSPDHTAKFLRDFYDAAPAWSKSQPQFSWPEIGHKFKIVYQSLLNNASPARGRD